MEYPLPSLQSICHSLFTHTTMVGKTFSVNYHPTVGSMTIPSFPEYLRRLAKTYNVEDLEIKEDPQLAPSQIKCFTLAYYSDGSVNQQMLNHHFYHPETLKAAIQLHCRETNYDCNELPSLKIAMKPTLLPVEGKLMFQRIEPPLPNKQITSNSISKRTNYRSIPHPKTSGGRRCCCCDDNTDRNQFVPNSSRATQTLLQTSKLRNHFHHVPKTAMEGDKRLTLEERSNKKNSKCQVCNRKKDSNRADSAAGTERIKHQVTVGNNFLAEKDNFSKEHNEKEAKAYSSYKLESIRGKINHQTKKKSPDQSYQQRSGKFLIGKKEVLTQHRSNEKGQIYEKRAKHIAVRQEENNEAKHLQKNGYSKLQRVLLPIEKSQDKMEEKNNKGNDFKAQSVYCNMGNVNSRHLKMNEEKIKRNKVNGSQNKDQRMINKVKQFKEANNKENTFRISSSKYKQNNRDTAKNKQVQIQGWKKNENIQQGKQNENQFNEQFKADLNKQAEKKLDKDNFKESVGQQDKKENSKYLQNEIKKQDNNEWNNGNSLQKGKGVLGKQQKQQKDKQVNYQNTVGKKNGERKERDKRQGKKDKQKMKREEKGNMPIITKEKQAKNNQIKATDEQETGNKKQNKQQVKQDDLETLCQKKNNNKVQEEVSKINTNQGESVKIKAQDQQINLKLKGDLQNGQRIPQRHQQVKGVEQRNKMQKGNRKKSSKIREKGCIKEDQQMENIKQTANIQQTDKKKGQNDRICQNQCSNKNQDKECVQNIIPDDNLKNQKHQFISNKDSKRQNNFGQSNLKQFVQKGNANICQDDNLKQQQNHKDIQKRQNGYKLNQVKKDFTQQTLKPKQDIGAKDQIKPQKPKKVIQQLQNGNKKNEQLNLDTYEQANQLQQSVVQKGGKRKQNRNKVLQAQKKKGKIDQKRQPNHKKTYKLQKNSANQNSSVDNAASKLQKRQAEKNEKKKQYTQKRSSQLQIPQLNQKIPTKKRDQFGDNINKIQENSKELLGKAQEAKLDNQKQRNSKINKLSRKNQNNQQNQKQTRQKPLENNEILGQQTKVKNGKQILNKLDGNSKLNKNDQNKSSKLQNNSQRQQNKQYNKNHKLEEKQKEIQVNLKNEQQQDENGSQIAQKNYAQNDSKCQINRQQIIDFQQDFAQKYKKKQSVKKETSQLSENSTKNQKRHKKDNENSDLYPQILKPQNDSSNKIEKLKDNKLQTLQLQAEIVKSNRKGQGNYQELQNTQAKDMQEHEKQRVNQNEAQKVKKYQGEKLQQVFTPQENSKPNGLEKYKQLQENHNKYSNTQINSKQQPRQVQQDPNNNSQQKKEYNHKREKIMNSQSASNRERAQRAQSNSKEKDKIKKQLTQQEIKLQDSKQRCKDITNNEINFDNNDIRQRLSHKEQSIVQKKENNEQKIQKGKQISHLQNQQIKNGHKQKYNQDAKPKQKESSSNTKKQSQQLSRIESYKINGKSGKLTNRKQQNRQQNAKGAPEIQMGLAKTNHSPKNSHRQNQRGPAQTDQGNLSALSENARLSRISQSDLDNQRIQNYRLKKDSPKDNQCLKKTIQNIPFKLQNGEGNQKGYSKLSNQNLQADIKKCDQKRQLELDQRIEKCQQQKQSNNNGSSKSKVKLEEKGKRDLNGDYKNEQKVSNRIAQRENPKLENYCLKSSQKWQEDRSSDAQMKLKLEDKCKQKAEGHNQKLSNYQENNQKKIQNLQSQSSVEKDNNLKQNQIKIAKLQNNSNGKNMKKNSQIQNGFSKVIRDKQQFQGKIFQQKENILQSNRKQNKQISKKNEYSKLNKNQEYKQNQVEKNTTKKLNQSIASKVQNSFLQKENKRQQNKDVKINESKNQSYSDYQAKKEGILHNDNNGVSRIISMMKVPGEQTLTLLTQQASQANKNQHSVQIQYKKQNERQQKGTHFQKGITDNKILKQRGSQKGFSKSHNSKINRNQRELHSVSKKKESLHHCKTYDLFICSSQVNENFLEGQINRNSWRNRQPYPVQQSMLKRHPNETQRPSRNREGLTPSPKEQNNRKALQIIKQLRKSGLHDQMKFSKIFSNIVDANHQDSQLPAIVHQVINSSEVRLREKHPTEQTINGQTIKTAFRLVSTYFDGNFIKRKLVSRRSCEVCLFLQNKWVRLKYREQQNELLDEELVKSFLVKYCTGQESVIDIVLMLTGFPYRLLNQDMFCDSKGQSHKRLMKSLKRHIKKMKETQGYGREKLLIQLSKNSLMAIKGIEQYQTLNGQKQFLVEAQEPLNTSNNSTKRRSVEKSLQQTEKNKNHQGMKKREQNQGANYINSKKGIGYLEANFSGQLLYHTLKVNSKKVNTYQLWIGDCMIYAEGHYQFLLYHQYEENKYKLIKESQRWLKCLCQKKAVYLLILKPFQQIQQTTLTLRYGFRHGQLFDQVDRAVQCVFSGDAYEDNGGYQNSRSLYIPAQKIHK